MKKIGALDREIFCQQFGLPDFEFCLFAEILIFAVFSLIFDARKTKISALGRVIHWQDFCFYQI